MAAQRPTKQQIERALFNAVYDATVYARIEDRDRPDLAVHIHGGSAFGVEVTEVYVSEPEARLENIDGYFEDLLAGKPHRHKDDIDELKVQTAQLKDKDGNVRHPGLKVIWRPLKPEHRLPVLLTARIEDKNARIPSYANGFTHINLIIHDRSGNPTPALGESFEVREFLSTDVKDALNSCGFGEVYVVQTVASGIEVFRPLRAMALLEAGYGFNQAGAKALETPIDIPDEDVHSLFVEACGNHGLLVEYVNDPDRGGILGLRRHRNPIC